MAGRPLIQKTLLAGSPILSPSLTQYPLLKTLPGSQFNPQFVQSSLLMDDSGNLQLLPGDYLLPVMTYCMNESRASPAGHTYVLSSMQGTRAQVIREVNTRASAKFSAEQIQFLSWSLQAGLSYDELTEKNKLILNDVNPNIRNQIQESLLKRIKNDWNAHVSRTAGLIPEFDELSEEFISELGEVGQSIKNLKNFRNELLVASDFDDLRNRITTQNRAADTKPETPWSKISEGIYARFITQKEYLNIGQIQIRVLPIVNKRSPNSDLKSMRSFDLHSLIADPRSVGIQPLSFSLILWPRGMIGAAVLAEPPLMIAALLATLLVYQPIDWDSFLYLKDIVVGLNDPKVKKMIEMGNQV